MSELTLYMYPGKEGVPSPSAPCTKVFLALAYGQLPHRVVKVGAEARKVSPTGRLPAMDFGGGDAVSDSVEILDRLEALDPPRRFWPEDPRERARDRVWERFGNEHLYWRNVYLRWVVPENAARTCARMLPRLPLGLSPLLHVVAKREARKRAEGQGVGLFPLERIQRDVLKAFDTYEAGIGDGPFLEGRAEPGRGDLEAAALLPQFAYQGIMPWAEGALRQRTALLAYVGRVYAACGLPAPDCVQGGAAAAT